MKKPLSLLLSVIMILGMVFSMPICTSAITVEEMDTDDSLSAFYNFEEDGFMQIGSQSHTSSKVKWQIDAITTLEYYYAGWGLSQRKANPVKDDTGVEGSVVNSSDMVLQDNKTTYNHWGTGGGIVINRKTDKGVEPLILEDNTTYTVEFDYLVNATHLYGDIVDPSDGTNSVTISTTATDTLSFGYGYKISESSGSAPVNKPVTTVATVASYKPSRDADGYFTSDSGTKQVGSWYHVSYTFTTGTFDSVFSTTNAPFLIFYVNLYTGGHICVDNIRISENVDINFHAMEGTIDSTADSGKVGDAIEFPTVSRYGYDFVGWYKTGIYSEKFTDTVFTKENAGNTVYAGWTQDMYSFESYAPAGDSANNSKFRVSDEKAYSGSRSMKYISELTSDDITAVNSYFTVRSLNSDGTYKITFKYYIESGADIVAYPVTAGEINSNNADAYTDSQVTLSSAGAGKWQTASMVFTSSMLNGSNLGLHIHANTSTATVVYIDDLTVSPVETDKGTLTINAGAGTTAGVTSRTVALAYGDKIDPDFVYNAGYVLEGYYTDSALTQKVPGNIFTSSLNGATVYPKWSNQVDLTKEGTATRTDGFAAANDENILYYNGSTGTASLVDAAAGSYVVEFLYKNSDGDVTLSAGEGSFTAKAGENNKWYKGFIPVTVSAQDVITLSAFGTSSLEIKDVYIKATDGLVYVAFDSREYGGNIEIIYGVSGDALKSVANPVISGKMFEGWYSGSEIFTSTVFPAESVSLEARMTELGESVTGDCNGDGKVNTTDLAFMKLYIAGIDMNLSSGADLNGDGKINPVDLVFLYKKLSGS